MDERLKLMQRAALPDALRALLQDYPREAWEAHPHFAGLVAFWLERHMMFRKLLDMLEQDAQSAVDKVLDPRQHQARIARFGGMLVNQLHGHHQIEDHHYFPVLSGLEPRLARGFEILDSDHHDLDGLLARFTDAANATLQGGEPGAFLTEVEAFAPFLSRHLEDEEDLIVPVILRHGPGGLH